MCEQRTKDIDDKKEETSQVKRIVIKSGKGWAIHGVGGFYTGWWHTKEDAINIHCEDLSRTWKECIKNGDRAIKIQIKAL